MSMTKPCYIPITFDLKFYTDAQIVWSKISKNCIDAYKYLSFLTYLNAEIVVEMMEKDGYELFSITSNNEHHFFHFLLKDKQNTKTND